MKTSTLLIIGGVAVLAYVLYRSASSSSGYTLTAATGTQGGWTAASSGPLTD